jgi:hypothetical protein
MNTWLQGLGLPNPALGAMTFSIMTLSIMGSFATHSIKDIQHNHTQHISIDCCYAELHYVQCRDYLNVMLSVIMLNVAMLQHSAKRQSA